MWIIEFLQTRTGQNAVAFSTVMLIGLAFFFRLHPFKKRKRRSTPKAVWTISQRYMYLNSLILTSTTLAELQQAQQFVNGFYRETFRDTVTLAVRKRYNSRLLEAYYNKEISLTQIPAKVAVCAN
jgi:hypothetical protein